MNIITSATLFTDAIGTRMSCTYSEVDEETGRVVGDNKRFDKVVIGAEDIAKVQAVLDLAQSYAEA